ncbi:MAG TPA: MlaD family protein [Solirubrobacteraceae bacterium]|jgi:virulence factor Mce-like protein|nr:MlaD family protein [Solirubrobacteraceae bacterium]
MVRRSRQRTLADPVIIGALTVLVAVVAIVLAFQANTGLPFVPRYGLHVRVANAEELTRGGEVHLGGALVGLVDSVTATRKANGQAMAVLNLELDKSIQPLPVDSRFTIREKDAIGEKFLDITPGHASRTWPQNSTVPVSQTGATTDLDQVLSMFTPPTRRGVTSSTEGFAEALAGRGAAVNDAISAFVPLVDDLGPVMRNLSSPRTQLGGFLRGLAAYTGALAPVAQQQASLFQNLDGTFRALASVAHPYLEQWIAQTPPTFETVTRDSPAEQAFVKDATGLFADLRPGAATLPSSAPLLASAFAAGTRNLPGTAALDRRTVTLSQDLYGYGTSPIVTHGLGRLTLTANRLTPPLRFLTPAQTKCNYVSLLLRNVASATSDPAGNGTVLGVTIVAIDDVLGDEAVPSRSPFLTPGTAGGINHAPLHVDPYPNTDAPGQVAECSAGKEPFSAARAVIGNPAGNLGSATEKTSRSRR